MLFRSLACCVVASGLALEVAAGPLPEASPRFHAIVDIPVVATVEVAAGRRSVPGTHTLHERQMPHLEQTWRRVKRVPSDAMLPMRIGLQQRNVQAGHERLMAMADPRSTAYGQHMSADAVVDLFAPEPESVEAVMDWLTGAGISKDRIAQSVNKQWVQFDATTAEAETLLLAEYYEFEHGDTGVRDVATTHYHLPRTVRPHIDYITPGIRLRQDSGRADPGRVAAAAKAKAKRGLKTMHTLPQPIYKPAALLRGLPQLNSSTCDRYVTPACVMAQYNMTPGTKAAAGNELGIFESLEQYYNKEDLDVYFAKVYPTVPNGTYPEDKPIDGSPTTVVAVKAGGEAMLDFEAAIPLIYPQKTVYFGTDDARIQHNETLADTPYAGFWNTFFDAIDGSYCSREAFGQKGNCNASECLDPAYPDTVPGSGSYNGSLQCGVYQPTNVISISYGGGEADLPAYYVQRQCTEVLKLALQGVSVVISSGDSGVAGFAGDNGYANGCAGPKNNIFYPSTLASCPYLLTVGGTQIVRANTTNTTSTTITATPAVYERAVASFGSGGGFSNYFLAPDYQTAAVDAYFAKVNLPFSSYDRAGTNFSSVGTGVFNRKGRAYPDVAAVADRYVTRLSGSWATIGGTSLAAPVWASILTRINEERLAVGKKTVGFVNNILYEHPEVFNDITVGNNPGCGTTGFEAAEGWDPVTGLGSPNYPKLLELLLNLP